MVKVEKVNIMDIEFVNTTKETLLTKHLFPILLNQQKCFIVTANPEIVMKAQEDQNYKQTVQQAHYIVPDGIGIIYAAKYLGTPLTERIAGFDLVLDLLKFANEKKLNVYFLGARDEVNQKATKKVKEKYPDINIVGAHHGFFDLEDSTVVESVKDANPDLILVALGFPKQEEWICKYMDDFEKGLFIGVGGSFDVLAGEVKRAPDIWIKLNLEWFYRLIKQPFRIKRIVKVFQFMFKVMFKRA